MRGGFLPADCLVSPLRVSCLQEGAELDSLVQWFAFQLRKTLAREVLLHRMHAELARWSARKSWLNNGRFQL